jgi:hypothetical protein
MQETTPSVETPVEAAVSISFDEIEKAARDEPTVEDAVAQEETPAFEPVAPDVSDDVAAFFAESVHTDVQADDMEETISAVDFTVSISPSDAADADLESEDDVAEAVSDLEEPAVAASFADKLERIRAVVSRQEEEELSAGYEEDGDNPELTGHFADLDAAFMRAADEDEHAQDKDAQDVVADAAQDIVEAFEQDEDAFEPSEALEGDSAASDEDETDDLDEILRRIEESGDDDDTKDNLFGGDAGAGDDFQDSMSKGERSDLDMAADDGDLEDFEDTESDLAAILGEKDSTADAKEHAPRQALPKIDEETGEDVSRLMAEADQQMQEPEGKTRRSAFAHLRAAVAARFADRSMDDEARKEEAEAEVYRSDLADVVKPRRAMAGEHRTERPHDERAAPLKLVAEQRIDTDEQPAARGPVAPRRIAATVVEDAEAPVEDTGFAAYATERGAQSLPELLEAAAAYLSYVEGHDQFSRPELMSRVRQADCGDFSREDGLRSFGQLLRTGKIEKIKGGRFTASAGIGYKPGHRAAG